jgi:phosphoribosylformylglycinamidine cyclo-ligase
VIKGIAEGCYQAGAALVGGETAEMPGMYHGNDFDLAGFCVGVVERDEIIDQKLVKTGDVLLGLASSGPHSNGYSLIRKVLEVSGASLDSEFAGTTLGRALLEPTRIYAKLVLQLIEQYQEGLHGLAHITGGGLTENLPRVLPDHTQANISLSSWQRPAIFEWLQTEGNIADDEMLRTFNCGIGMVLVVEASQAEAILKTCQDSGIQGWRLGEIVTSTSTQVEPFVHYVA